MEPDRARLAISVLDLTDLGDDTSTGAVLILCGRAAAARTAAVCVWPRFVGEAGAALSGSGVRVATVVNFPSGAEPVEDVVAMTRRALIDGADEIDVVLPHRAWLTGDEATSGAMLDGVREAAGGHILKVIIETGELPDRAAVDRAAHFAIAHGADFVKTSTGKTAVSATPEAAEIVLEAIAVSGRPVGFKASGGIRTAADADVYLALADTIMGPSWASPATFRFGASGLLDALQAEVGGGRGEPSGDAAY
jgi:deoxyribose-phosphate aldolase